MKEWLKWGTAELPGPVCWWKGNFGLRFMTPASFLLGLTWKIKHVHVVLVLSQVCKLFVFFIHVGSFWQFSVHEWSVRGAKLAPRAAGMWEAGMYSAEQMHKRMSLLFWHHWELDVSWHLLLHLFELIGTKRFPLHVHSCFILWRKRQSAFMMTVNVNALYTTS